MKEKPIIFSADSVRAILGGRKTQTRRPVKFALTSQSDGAKRRIFSERDIDEINQLLSIRQTHPLNTFAPYQVGDRLWVKEAWRYADWTLHGEPIISYASDGAERVIDDFPDEWSERLLNVWAGLSDDSNYNIDERAADRKWRSPIFMPRWASRITLEVTAVRVERLQDISIKDVNAEGVTDPQSLSDPPSDTGRPIEWFSAAWDKLNGKRAPWQSNSWVWVIEFKMLEVNQ